MRRSVELRIITEALQKMGPHTPAVRLWGRAPGATAEQGADGNVWAGDVHDVARHIVTRLYGRPDESTPKSPLAQAEDAKHRGDTVGQLYALSGGHDQLVTAPWYPVLPGDLVHVHYEATPTLPAYGETYLIGDVGGGLKSMQLINDTYDGELDGMTGICAVEAADDPLYELWFEAGPQRLTIVRDGRPVHIGGAR